MWLGIDGGGTKTEFVLFDGDMCRREAFRLPTCHPTQVGFDGMTRVLAAGLERARAMAESPIEGVGLGLAGFGQEAVVRERMAATVREVLGETPYRLVSDVEAAWAASLDLADGIVLISGTGSIAYGRAGGVSARAGGWGYLLGDEGSGHWLGRELLRLFTREADGRDPRGALFDIVMDRLALSDPSDVIGYARIELAGDRTRTAALARLLADAARAGDAVALAAYERAAAELVDLVCAVRDGIAIEDAAVSYVGGVFEGAGRLLLDPLQRVLPAGCHLQAPCYEPAAGACLLLRRDGAGAADCLASSRDRVSGASSNPPIGAGAMSADSISGSAIAAAARLHADTGEGSLC